MKNSGWRKPTPGLGIAEKHAQAGERTSVSKARACVAVKRVASHIGLKAGDMLLLDTLGAFTQPQDWEMGRRPIVWASNAYLMAQTGFSLSALKRHARRLAETGVIAFKDSPNGKRWGRRDADGVIVEAYGFDLSPLAARTEEFEALQNQVIYVSATPADYEMQKSGGVFVEQVIRPTGLLDPVIEVRPSKNQIDDLVEEIQQRVQLDERTLVTTLTKRMAEELTKYLARIDVRCRYIHSDVDTLERVEIMQDLRKGIFDVLVGVNLLREGLDLPEVSLVAVIDADKEGFLRSNRSLTQTVGRAARHLNGKAIMYADKITHSMQKTIDETNYRREKQMAYNQKHNITPKALVKSLDSALARNSVSTFHFEKKERDAREPDPAYLTPEQRDKLIRNKRSAMEKAAKELDFMMAAQLRDEIRSLQEASG